MIYILVAIVAVGLMGCDFQSRTPPLDHVYPYLDSANSRWFFFSSASRPFGMVNLSPDMAIDGAWNSGYQYDEDTIKFFSHIHAWQLSGVPVMPTTGEFKGHLGPKVYGSHYTHDNEIVKPGYHAVVLKDYQIKVELTSTTRVGFHRYTFPRSNQASVLIDLGTVLGPSGTKSGFISKKTDRELIGYVVMAETRRRPKPIHVYFVISLDRSFKAMGVWQDGNLLGAKNSIDGNKIGAYVNFETQDEDEILMKVGISYVSIEQARLNMKTELPHWDFEKVVEESHRQWNDYLGRISAQRHSTCQNN